jgi:GTP pyrophosphokinase
LNSELRNGDTVKIITSPKQMPNQAWLKIVKTTKAITRIKRFLKKEEETKSIELGKEILEKSLRKIKKLYLLKVIIKEPEKMGYNNTDLIFSNFAIIIKCDVIIYVDIFFKFNIIHLDNMVCGIL